MCAGLAACGDHAVGVEHGSSSAWVAQFEQTPANSNRVESPCGRPHAPQGLADLVRCLT